MIPGQSDIDNEYPLTCNEY